MKPEFTEAADSLLTNREVLELREIVQSAAVRRDQKKFIVEGPHLVQTALEEVPRAIEFILSVEGAQSEAIELGAKGARIPIRNVSRRNAERLADTEHTQGVFALIRMPNLPTAFSAQVLALDGLQDPGNVGTIIRTAAWFGVTDIIAGKGTVDCYSPKVVRATQGAIFGARIHRSGGLGDQLRKLKKSGHSVISTSIAEGSVPLSEIEIPKKFVLVLGSEAHGIAPEVGSLSDIRVTIPRVGRGESLNVAVSCGIILASFSARK